VNYNDHEISAMQDYFKKMSGKVNVIDFSKNFITQIQMTLKN